MNIGVISRPKKGFSENGDAYLVESIDHQTLISVIDGIGHGVHAQKAANRCVDAIKQHLQSGNFSLTSLFDACHKALRDTHGAVMAVLLVDPQHRTVHYAGIGNITTHIIGGNNSSSIYPIPRGGIVGYNMPKVKEHTYPYATGDLILMHTDGLVSRINSEILHRLQGLEEQRIAEELFKEYARDEDDATLIVARERRTP